MAVWGDNSLPDGDYIFAVQSTDNAGNRSGLDWQEVIIDNAPPVIALQAPAPGARVPDNTPYAIHWTVADVSPVNAVKIEVSANGGDSWSEVAAAAPNTGIFVWTTPDVASADIPTYKLRLTAVDGAAATLGEAGHKTVFISGAFTLAEAPAPATALVATDPDGGAAGMTGADFHLAWTPSLSIDAASQDIYLLPQGVEFGDASQNPVGHIGDATTAAWSGPSDLTEDSVGNALDASLRYRLFVLTVDSADARTVSAAAPVPWPAAPTAVAASDVDASAGVTLADVKATWVPSTSTGVTHQAIYVLPSSDPSLDVFGVAQHPVATLDGNLTTQWRGDPGDPAQDSAGHPLAAGAYSVWVVAMDEDGHKVASSPAPLVVSAP